MKYIKLPNINIDYIKKMNHLKCVYRKKYILWIIHLYMSLGLPNNSENKINSKDGIIFV